MQVAEAVHRYGRELGVRVLPVYGGASMEQQIRALERGVDVVVATPGRALDHMRRGTLAPRRPADARARRSRRDARHGLRRGPRRDPRGDAEDAADGALLGDDAAAHRGDRRDATFERPGPDHDRAREDRAPGKMPQVRQMAYIVPRAHKPAALGRVLDIENPASAIVFCRTRLEVDDLTETLNGHGLRAEALHGGMSQEQRDRVMKKFRAGTLDLLVATDVAARGLDIEHLSHVVNYDVPSAPEAYVHRIGRTGRAGREGVAITLAEPREHRLLRNIERLTKQKIEVATVPTVADLRARRLELTRASLRESILAGELDDYRVVVESLAEEFDPMDVAAAAVKLAHPAAAGSGSVADEHEIPAVAAPPPPRAAKAGTKYKSGGRGPGGSASIFVGAGRAAGVRPGDLVGAIVNEAKVNPRDVGSIQIAERFSLVEVPEKIAESVMRALRGTMIRGQKVVVRRDKDAGR